MYGAAVILRQEIMSMSKSNSLSEHLADLSNGRVDLPVALNNFLCGHLCGDNIMSDTNAPAPSLN